MSSGAANQLLGQASFGTLIVSSAEEVAKRSMISDDPLYVRLPGRNMEVKVELRDAMGANVWNLTPKELNNVAKGTHQFLVAGVTDKSGKRYNFAICAFKRDDKNAFIKALSDKRLKSIAESGAFKIDRLSVANEVYDCQTYINKVLNDASLANIDQQPGKDIIEASKGHTLNFSRISEIAGKGKGKNKVPDYFDTLRPGQVIFFLKEVPAEDVDIMKESVTLTKFKGRWYAPEHVAIYSGKDESGQHMISQAHIYGGSIVTEPAESYVIQNKNYFDAIVAIPPEYFAHKKGIRKQLLSKTIPRKNDS